jgi:ABC-type dipeptide/oligopeptide/nickel transport system permease subunit
MKSFIILSAVLITMAIVALSFGEEIPAHLVQSGSNETLQLVKAALPQMIFIIVLMLNLGASLIDHDRNFKTSLMATIILLALTYWGGFYKPLFDFLNAQI